MKFPHAPSRKRFPQVKILARICEASIICVRRVVVRTSAAPHHYFPRLVLAPIDMLPLPRKVSTTCNVFKPIQSCPRRLDQTEYILLRSAKERTNARGRCHWLLRMLHHFRHAVVG